MNRDGGRGAESAHVEDELATTVDGAAQRATAQRVQDAFIRAFRLSAEGDDDGGREQELARIALELEQWVAQAGSGEARALRRALLLHGLDQWGLAWTQAFGLLSIAGLSALIASLRMTPGPQEEAQFLQQYEAIDVAEANAIDFKLELRRSIHLALWYSSIAAEAEEEALRLAGSLASLLLALARQMPELGWRLVADTLAFIQIRCLSEGLASSGSGQHATQALLHTLARELPPAQRDDVMAHANQAVFAWQQRQRETRVRH